MVEVFFLFLVVVWWVLGSGKAVCWLLREGGREVVFGLLHVR